MVSVTQFILLSYTTGQKDFSTQVHITPSSFRSMTEPQEHMDEDLISGRIDQTIAAESLKF